MKKIALIGAGNGAQTMAADLASRGYEVNMYEQTAFMGKLGWLKQSLTINVHGVLNVTGGSFTTASGKYCLHNPDAGSSISISDVSNVSFSGATASNVYNAGNGYKG